MDAPAGTNAVAVTGPNSNNTIQNNGSLTVDVDHTSNNLINNNVNVSAHSGDATVSNNTKGGDATSGDASAGVNILNMVDSEFDIDDWFGILFINVFGKWRGSFGINTEAGNRPIGSSSGVASSTATTTPSSPAQRAAAQVFSFMPHNSGNNGEATQGVVAGATDESTPPSTLSSSGVTPTPISTSSTGSANHTSMLAVAGILTLFGALMLGGERVLSLIRLRLLA